MGKQKIVIRLQMDNEKKRSKAMKIVVGFPGVSKAEISGKSKDEISVTSEGLDSVTLTKKLRKKMGYAELLKVESDDKDEDKEKDKDKIEAFVWPYTTPAVPPYYYESYPQQEPSCNIM